MQVSAVTVWPLVCRNYKNNIFHCSTTDYYVFIHVLSYIAFDYFINKGFKLNENAEVPVGSDVTIDISSLPRNSAISCELYLDDTWNRDKKVLICATIPIQYPCNPQTQYQGRATYTNETTLQITRVHKNESGIYSCKPAVGSGIIIAGVIIVGRFMFNRLFHLNLSTIFIPKIESIIKKC